MKKVLLWVTAFTLGLASCQKSEVVDDVNAGSNELNFGVYQGKQTRAGELMNDDLTKDGVSFPLHAYRGEQTGKKTKYFDETLTYGQPEKGKWNTSIPRFLPEGSADFLQFYAYYAYNKSANKKNHTDITYEEIPSDALDTDAYPTLKYTIQKNETTGTNPSGADVDLVAATVNDNVGTSITIPFKHILSQINFGVKGYYGAKIQIKDIVIYKVFNDGIFSFNPDPLAWGWKRITTPITLSDYNYTFPAFTTPGATGSTGAWTNTNKEEEIRYIFGDGGNWGPGKKADIWYVTEENKTIKGEEIVVGSPDNKDTPRLSNSLMLMPQDLKEGMTEAYVQFKYNIRDLDNNYVIGGPGESDMIEGKFDLSMGDKGAYADKWKPNLRYLYIIDFTGYLDGQKLTFDVDVETNPWENYDKPGEGIVYLSSTGQPVFKDVKDAIKANAGNYPVAKGHVFSNIKWDWSSYTMNKDVFDAVDQTFTVDFSEVIFNGNTVTVTAPKGFKVDKVAGGVPATTKLTFTTLATPTAPETTTAVKDGTISADAGVLYANATWTLSAPSISLSSNESFIVDASKVWLNGHELTVTPPADYTLSGTYPKYKIVKK